MGIGAAHGVHAGITSGDGCYNTDRFKTGDSAPLVHTQHLLQPRPYPLVLSLVIPLFDEEAGFDFLRAEVEDFARTVTCRIEIVLVNDGSSDGTIQKIAEWAEHDPHVKALHLSRNFGHQLAATAGLDYSTGDATVLIDADLQDPLPVVHEMIARYCEGYDVVYGQRESRAGESGFKLTTAWLFYRLMRYIVYRQLPLDTGDFRLLSRECLDGLKTMRETHRFLRGMVAWVGFPQIAVMYQRVPRLHGSTKYPLRKMLSFAWTAATSFSTLPLRISLYLGTVVGAVRHRGSGARDHSQRHGDNSAGLDLTDGGDKYHRQRAAVQHWHSGAVPGQGI